MKRNICYIILLLALIFTAGCNKEKENPVPTPTVAATPTSTPSPTPTPTPVNRAKENIDKLPEQFDKLMSYKVDNTVDYSNGMGCDITMKFSLGQQITQLLGMTDLESIGITGTVDSKDTIAANLDFCINDDAILNAHVFADAQNLLFNLPAYSSNYAAITWEELVNAVNEEATDEESVTPTLSDNSSQIIRTINTVDTTQMPSDEELEKLLRGYAKDLAECFQAVPGITEHTSIGTGDYLFAGEKHTARADIHEIYAILESLEADLQSYGEIDFPLEELENGEESFLFVDYYTDGAGNYGWASYSDTDPDDLIVFVNTAVGFCMYRLLPDGTETMGMYSVKSSEKAGTVTLVFGEEEPLGVFNYEYSDNSFSIFGVLDTIELTMDFSKTNDTIRCNITLLVDGVSIVVKETASPTHTDVSASLASYGMEYLTMSLSTTLRDYVEIPVPQNIVTMDTWTEELDQETLLADLMQLMQDYPFLMTLFGGSEDTEYEDNLWDDDTTGTTGDPYELPADYTDDFMGMTGYAVDSDGFVYFYPEEDEVLAAGKPSTGYDTLALSDDQKQQLFTIAETAIPNCKKVTYSLYQIYGSIQYNDVQSYYSLEHEFSDPDNWLDHRITISLDPVSGEFISVDINHTSKEDALRIANEMFTVLGGTYTITDKMAEEYTINEDGFAFSGYDWTTYGDIGYDIEIFLDYNAPVW